MFHLLVIDNPDITLTTCSPLNPAMLLPTTLPVGSNPTHSYPERVESLMTPRQGLTDSPLPSPDLTMFVDRSSILDDHGGH
jgi:hypothetical protein